MLFLPQTELSGVSYFDRFLFAHFVIFRRLKSTVMKVP